MRRESISGICTRARGSRVYISPSRAKSAWITRPTPSRMGPTESRNPSTRSLPNGRPPWTRFENSSTARLQCSLGDSPNTSGVRFATAINTSTGVRSRRRAATSTRSTLPQPTTLPLRLPSSNASVTPSKPELTASHAPFATLAGVLACVLARETYLEVYWIIMKE